MEEKRNILVIDNKGTYFDNNSNELKENGYKVNVINFRDPSLGEGWNPLNYPYIISKENRDNAQDILEDMAKIIFVDEKDLDPFWGSMCVNLFTGLSLYLFKKDDIKLINLYNVYHFIDNQEEFVKTFKESCNDEIILDYVNQIILAPSETQMGILSVFKQKLGLYITRENLNNLLMNTTFDINEEPNVIIVITNEEKEHLNKLTSILLNEVKATNKYEIINN